MNKKQFFIHRTSCRVHNKKTEALSDILTRLNSTLVTFDDNFFTPEKMLANIKRSLAVINMNSRGNDIEVHMSQFGTISYTFYNNPNSGEAVAHITLYPVTQSIIQDSDVPHA